MKNCLSIALLLVMLPTPVTATSPDRGTLKGLRKFHVVIERLGNEAERAGLTEEQLKTNVELRLRRSRIPVADSSRDAYLYVNINSFNVSSLGCSGWVYSVHVGLSQSVTLDRDKSINPDAETWTSAMLGAVAAQDFVSRVRQSVGDQIDRFVNDYLAENP